MVYRNHPDPLPSLALNAIRLVTPDVAIPAVFVPYDRDRLHAFLDRPSQDVFATRIDNNRMVVVPLVPNADLPGKVVPLRASEHLRLFSTLAREAVFRHIKGIKGDYRVIGRRPPTVEAQKQKNIIPASARLPDWLQKRRTLIFETRTLTPQGKSGYVVLTCVQRFRPVIDRNCYELVSDGVSLVGRYVSTWVSSVDPQLADHLQLAGQVTSSSNGRLTLTDHAEGPAEIDTVNAYLEPSFRNFRAVVEALKFDEAEQTLKIIQQEEGRLRAGPEQLRTAQQILGYFASKPIEIATGVQLQIGQPVQEGRALEFPFSESFEKASLSFDPSGAKSMRWQQGGLDKYGPYDSASFEKKRPRIAVICEARERGQMATTIADFLNGVPDAKSTGGLRPHETGLVGRYKLQKPQVDFFEATGDGVDDYATAARRALEAGAASDQAWDLAVVQVRRAWKERPPGNSPYWATKAIFLRRDVPVQALSTEMIAMGKFEYACALANVSLATYAKLGGTPWILQSRPSTDHELVFGLGSHTRKEGRRGAGERVVGITTVFSSQGHYLLDARTGAVGFDDYPEALKTMLIEAVQRVRKEEAWRESDAVRLVFHAFVQMRRETTDAVIKAVEALGLGQVSFAFLHVAEEHPFMLFDRAQETGRGAFGPKRGQAVELSDHEWLVSMIGREQITAQYQGIPTPVLLRLHERSTFRDMRTLSKQAADFGCHSWRTFGNSHTPITLQYADEIAKQLAGLELTNRWNSDDALVGRIMRKPWFL